MRSPLNNLLSMSIGCKNGFHFITVDQLIRAHQGKAALPTKPVLLTVDDGYQSFYQNAYPVIKAKNPSGTCGSGFMVRAKSRAESRFSGEEIPRDKILSWGELKEMQDSGFVEIASHSYHLHRGITGNPQGNSEPAATTRFMM